MKFFFAFSGDLRVCLEGDAFKVGGMREGLIGVSSIRILELEAALVFHAAIAFGTGRGVDGNSRADFFGRTEPGALRVAISSSCC